MTNSVVMDTTNNMLMPKGTTAERPVSPANGMMRYNTTLNEVEVYQSSTWRSVSFKESSQISQQTLGPGDDLERHFGPLNPAPPTTTASGSTYGPQNLLVYIDTVPQIPNTNFVLIQNPSLAIGTIISFDTNTITSSNTSIINFSTLSFYTGQTITVTGSGSNNGTYTIATVTASTIVVVESLVTEAQGANVTITAGYTAGWYVKFNAAVPASGDLGQPLYITVLHGFDK
jgi:hypothetical protein